VEKKPEKVQKRRKVMLSRMCNQIAPEIELEAFVEGYRDGPMPGLTNYGQIWPAAYFSK
jgi:hypothetical protein